MYDALPAAVSADSRAVAGTRGREACGASDLRASGACLGGHPGKSLGSPLRPHTCPPPWMPPNSRPSPSKGKRVLVASHSLGFHTYSPSCSRRFWADGRPRPYAGKPRRCWQAEGLPGRIPFLQLSAWQPRGPGGCSLVSGGSLATGAWTAWSCAGRWPSSSKVSGDLFHGRLLPSSTEFQSKQNGTPC